MAVRFGGEVFWCGGGTGGTGVVLCAWGDGTGYVTGALFLKGRHRLRHRCRGAYIIFFFMFCVLCRWTWWCLKSPEAAPGGGAVSVEVKVGGRTSVEFV